jgi:DNA-binding beta-propeller fold protein YncE
MRTIRVVAIGVFLGLAIPGAHLPADAGPPAEVFAEVPPPGHPEGIAVHGDAVIAGTGGWAANAVVPDESPSKVFWFDRSTGSLVAEVAVEGQSLSEDHALLGMTNDARGRLYVIDRRDYLLPGDGRPARLLRFERRGELIIQEVFATFPDLRPCLPVGDGAPCSPTLYDRKAVPNSIAFDTDGSAYVSDTAQGLVWRVGPGGGTAQPWFADPRFDSMLGPNGLAIDYVRRLVYVTSSPEGTGGTVWRLPLAANPRPAELETFHTFGQSGLVPDGLAMGESGEVYVAMASGGYVVRLDRAGEEKARYPVPGSDSRRSTPANVAFDGEGAMFVTNLDFEGPTPDGSTIVRIVVGDAGLQPARPEILP